MGKEGQGTTQNNEQGVNVSLENNDIDSIVKWCDGEIMKWTQMAKGWNCDIVISCDIILLGQTCNTTRFIYFSKHL